MSPTKVYVLTITLTLFNAAAAAPIESPIQLDRDGVIKGSLILPDGVAQPPVVLLIAGSGPTDRDGNGPNLHNDSLRQLAQALAAAGVASVRYDKRGVAASAPAGGAEQDLRFEHYVDDAAAWVRLLKQDKRFTKTIVVGHSEGALIGTLAASASGADGVVLLAGPAQRASTALRVQLAGKLPPNLATDNERVLASLENGRQASEVPAELAALYRPSVQPYLMSWFRYDPAREFGRLKVPAAVIQGSSDLQVGIGDAFALQQAKPGTALVVVPGMNHVLKMARGDMQAQARSYAAPDTPLSPTLVPAMVRFIGTH
ncbi:alpha/beta hydrolase [Massilia sp. YMA4]|uniref:alpha/beta hydrolase n=1 Tax=Massilia sp. YMA4 TaxID=1593482 RepID=UPI000DD0F09E|nr:alpha/beta fold hydrolase [Massilia sp. YMA4]AXA94773.1 alpha/beta hydrolase [Massilia sp. YMA4]